MHSQVGHWSDWEQFHEADSYFLIDTTCLLQLQYSNDSWCDALQVWLKLPSYAENSQNGPRDYSKQIRYMSIGPRQCEYVLIPCQLGASW